MEARNMDIEKRISIDPTIQHGKPCIYGTRIPVYIILELLEYGLTIPEILEEYPHLDEKDIKACIAFTKRLVDGEEISPLVVP